MIKSLHESNTLVIHPKRLLTYPPGYKPWVMFSSRTLPDPQITHLPQQRTQHQPPQLPVERESRVPSGWGGANLSK